MGSLDRSWNHEVYGSGKVSAVVDILPILEQFKGYG